MLNIDPSAQTFRLPDSLLFPIAVRSKDLFENYVGKIKRVDAAKEGALNGQEVAVLIEPPVRPCFVPYQPTDTDTAERHQVQDGLRQLTLGLQVWVNPQLESRRETGVADYRDAYLELAKQYSLPPATGKFLDHVMNRQLAVARGYGWVRLCPVDPAVNTNAGGLYGGEVRIDKKDPTNPASKRMVRDFSAHLPVSKVIYADPFEITKMINWKPGTVSGGMEGVAKLMKYIYPAKQNVP